LTDVSGARWTSSWRPASFDIRAQELRDLVRRSREVILLAAITGAVVGIFVRGFEWVVVEICFHYVVNGPLWVGAVAPGVGLLLTAIVLKTVGRGASPATADEYLRAFHDAEYPLRTRAFVGRMAASVVTLGSGGAMGLEGPSIYGGSSVGAMIQRRLPAPFRGIDHRTLLVAGAAAGVSAVFKAPATGAIFALEVPFRDQMAARRLLLPALVASATGYLAFVALSDTQPIFAFYIQRGGGFEYRDLLGAIVIGVCCAVGARAFSRLIRHAKAVALQPVAIRVAGAGVVMALLFVASRLLTGESLTIGSGYEVLRWLFDVHPLWLLVAVFVLRSLATATTVAGGGVGGVFIPLVVAGAIVGRAIGEVINPDERALYILLGMAAFLGAGYRVPLAAVVFVAETTGQPGFIVPALFAAVAAELVMGEQSITAFQKSADAT
jgi:CIC family chloride channel protein